MNWLDLSLPAAAVLIQAMNEPALDERFDRSAPDPRLRWLNPPPAWRVGPPGFTLVLEAAAGTDFWQQTHYGFRADNGHFLHTEVAGPFVLTTRVRFHPVHQYDQAGLMVRVGSSCWIKTAVEFEPKDLSKLGAVVTNHGFSDWSLQDFPAEANEVQLRIRRDSADFRVEWASAEGEQWRLLRVAHLHEAGEGPLACGLYACSPKGRGFRAEFAHLRLTGP
jgi:hypothetical protein